MEKYPDFATYREMYARYFLKGVESIAQLVGEVKDKTVVDLCCGDGRLTEKLLSLGSKEVIMIDRESRMIPHSFKKRRGVKVHVTHVEKGLNNLISADKQVDIITCQQAINYWLTRESGKLVSKTLKTGGVFVFNTFNKKPNKVPRVLEYELFGKKYIEVSWRVGSKVNHLQVLEGFPPHYTTFRWISPDEYTRILSRHFKIEMFVSGATSTYRCTKK